MSPNRKQRARQSPERVSALLGHLPGFISLGYLQRQDRRTLLACAWSAPGRLTAALRTGSPEQLQEALLAGTLLNVLECRDPRDLMLGLPPYLHVAGVIGVDPIPLFDGVADRLPPGLVADTLRAFGRRQDVTLEAWGYRQIDTPQGPEVVRQ